MSEIKIIKRLTHHSFEPVKVSDEIVSKSEKKSLIKKDTKKLKKK